MKVRPATPGNVTPEQVLGSQLAAAVGEDGSMLEMIALVIKPGYWPTVTLRKRLKLPELDEVVKIFARHHIVGVEIRSQDVTSGHQINEKADPHRDAVRRDSESKEGKR